MKSKIIYQKYSVLLLKFPFQMVIKRKLFDQMLLNLVILLTTNHRNLNLYPETEKSLYPEKKFEYSQPGGNRAV